MQLTFWLRFGFEKNQLKLQCCLWRLFLLLKKNTKPHTINLIDPLCVLSLLSGQACDAFHLGVLW